MFFIHREGRLAKIFYNPQAWHDIFFITNFFISFTLLLVILGENIWALAAFWGEGFLTLHYSIYFGVDWLGGFFNFLIFGAIALFVFLANFILANALFSKNKILSYLLTAASSLILFFLLIAASLVVYINWSNPRMG